MRVLHSRGDRLLACGTNAFQPQCTWRQLESLRTVLSNQSGIAVAPYSPRFNATSALTADGDVVAATPTDFSGLDPAVYRRAGSGGRAALRTGKYDSRLLSGPQFVGSFETADFVYFVFREEALELLSCGKVSCRAGAMQTQVRLLRVEFDEWLMRICLFWPLGKSCAQTTLIQVLIFASGQKELLKFALCYKLYQNSYKVQGTQFDKNMIVVLSQIFKTVKKHSVCPFTLDSCLTCRHNTNFKFQ